MSDYLPKGTPAQAGRYDSAGRRLDPLTPGELERAREAEQLRKRWDPGYVTAEQAATIPQEVMDQDPMLRDRVARSMEDWPERRMAASQLVGDDLPGGCGETSKRIHLDAASLFKQPTKE